MSMFLYLKKIYVLSHGLVVIGRVVFSILQEKIYCISFIIKVTFIFIFLSKTKDETRITKKEKYLFGNST